MKKYLGTKLITATPMNRLVYNQYRGWDLPADEDGNDEGFLVEYLDGGQSNDPRHAGYISWSPKGVFETSYRESTGLTFGDAVEALKVGKKVAREGWNGKGMFLYYVPANAYLPTTLTGEEIARKLEEKHQGHVPYGAYIAMWTAQNNVVPWLASQTDVLAEDWVII
jgi:hypothetical protein